MRKIEQYISKTVLSVVVSLALLVWATLAFVKSHDAEVSEQPQPPKLVLSIPELYGLFDPTQPGYGTTDYPGHGSEHIPKSHAMVLLAEIERVDNGLYPALPSLALASGMWLLNNSDLNADGVVGWGVPVAWDAYGDGSENPKDTEYTISTAIVVDALLTWMERDPTAPRKDILNRVEAALEPYLAPGVSSPSGMAPYSLRASDRPYNTFNPAGYLAGQLQRFSGYASTPELQKEFSNLADRIVEVLLEHQQINQANGAIFWHYSIEEPVSNDMAHALYIVHGLQSYIENNGRLAHQIDMAAITRHMEDFPDTERGVLRAWPNFRVDVDRPARSYGLGMAMSFMCARDDLGNQGYELGKFIPDYIASDGKIMRYPQSTNVADDVSVNEYQAYLYRGIVQCELWQARQLTQAQMLPLSPHQKPEGQTSVTQSATLPVAKRLANETTYQRLTLYEDKGWRIQRDTPGDKLFIEKRPSEQDAVSSISFQVSSETDSLPVFRAALAISTTNLHLVVYDNVQQKNILQEFSSGPDGIRLTRPFLSLPSFRDPAGGTYEMVPKVFLLPGEENTLHLVAGPLLLSIEAGKIIDQTELNHCTQTVEAIATPRGPVILCREMAAEKADAVFSIQGPGSENVSQPQSGRPVFGLSEKWGTVSYTEVTDEDSLQKLINHELSNTMQNGWMQYGVSNREARISWDQIYYLNGFLDILLLAEKDSNYHSLVKSNLPLLKQRIAEEIHWIAQHWENERYRTRAFSVDRSEALFAVQTSRLLLLLQRYLQEVSPDDAAITKTYRKVKTSVHCLIDHIDQISLTPQPPGWLKTDTPYLAWPKGSAFYFDGLNVPYNHQNEWAYSVLSTEPDPDCPSAVQSAQKILQSFLTRESSIGSFPLNGTWDYWWGQAYMGWTKAENISDNMPSYPGDHIKAWISFRSIDVMSALASLDALPRWTQENLISSAQALLRDGHVYPFVNQALVQKGHQPIVNPVDALKYSRAGASWELQNTAWSLLYWINQIHE